MILAGTEKRHSTEQRNTVTMGVPATQDSASEWRKVGAQVNRIRPKRNEWRYYRMAVWPDLFGRAPPRPPVGRIGTQGRVCLDPHSDIGPATNALARLARA